MQQVLKKPETSIEEEILQLYYSSEKLMMNEVSHERDTYLGYKAGDFPESLKDQELDMITLSFLESLGYDTDEPGTYFYKAVLVKIANELLDSSKRNNQDFCQKLIEMLQNAYSQFYFDLARNDRDIGVKTFHAYISHSHNQRENTVESEMLLDSIYGMRMEELDSGQKAFLVGNYIAENLAPISKNRPKLKLIEKR